MESNLKICITKLNSIDEFKVLKDEINSRLTCSDMAVESFSSTDGLGKISWLAGYASATRELLELMNG